MQLFLRLLEYLGVNVKVWELIWVRGIVEKYSECQISFVNMFKNKSSIPILVCRGTVTIFLKIQDVFEDFYC